MRLLNIWKNKSSLYKFLGPVYKILINFFSIFDTAYQYSYSQEGEDRILQNIFRNKNNGFFVDIGAFHPKVFSNTYLFYRKGWRGINIDAFPGSMKSFNNKRKKDINIETAISEYPKKVILYKFNEPALNTIDQKLAFIRNENTRFKIIGKVEIQSQPLSLVLDNYLPVSQQIDFISIDVEGHELSVLKSNDWSKYRPTVILLEILDCKLIKILNSEIYKFVISKNYHLYSKTLNTLIFIENNYKINSYE